MAPPRALRPNIVLAGFMAAGKTTVGGLLSGLTGMPLEDTDEAVERRAGATVAEVFASRGEGTFRRLEAEEIRRAAVPHGAILAVGGGAVVDPANVEALRAGGTIYLLQVDAAEAMRRAGGGGSRPLLVGDAPAVEDLYSSREAAYRDAADVVVPTEGRSPEQVAEHILMDFARRHAGERHED
ncbi:MAG: shikimate kinase [Actinobacteria bacterium]|nr:shikimate kinase [Actinomycetota bacterium]MBU1942250.1 shikimate kinase [Actinomycetota bacterium]MBU2687401.1 shikimate kinase [Actinomycetota bacterium]